MSDVVYVMGIVNIMDVVNISFVNIMDVDMDVVTVMGAVNMLILWMLL